MTRVIMTGVSLEFGEPWASLEDDRESIIIEGEGICLSVTLGEAALLAKDLLAAIKKANETTEV